MQNVTRATAGRLSVLRRTAGGNTAAAVGASCAGRRGYHDNIVEHYENPRNVGSLDKADKFVGTVDENGVITESKFKTFGCGSAIASSSVATEWLKGRSVDDSLKIKNTDIAGHLKLPPVKLHCSMLAEDAIKAAIKDLQDKGALAQPQQADAA
eukprot:jgi/Undpi1/13261/HiC_scaffold_8.g02923.m1